LCPRIVWQEIGGADVFPIGKCRFRVRRVRIRELETGFTPTLVTLDGVSQFDDGFRKLVRREVLFAPLEGETLRCFVVGASDREPRRTADRETCETAPRQAPTVYPAERQMATRWVDFYPCRRLRRRAQKTRPVPRRIRDAGSGLVMGAGPLVWLSGDPPALKPTLPSVPDGTPEFRPVRTPPGISEPPPPPFEPSLPNSPPPPRNFGCAPGKKNCGALMSRIEAPLASKSGAPSKCGGRAACSWLLVSFARAASEYELTGVPPVMASANAEPALMSSAQTRS